MDLNTRTSLIAATTQIASEAACLLNAECCTPDEIRQSVIRQIFPLLKQCRTVELDRILSFSLTAFAINPRTYQRQENLPRMDLTERTLIIQETLQIAGEIASLLESRCCEKEEIAECAESRLRTLPMTKDTHRITTLAFDIFGIDPTIYQKERAVAPSTSSSNSRHLNPSSSSSSSSSHPLQELAEQSLRTNEASARATIEDPDSIRRFQDEIDQFYTMLSSERYERLPEHELYHNRLIRFREKFDEIEASERLINTILQEVDDQPRTSSSHTTPSNRPAPQLPQPAQQAPIAVQPHQAAARPLPQPARHAPRGLPSRRVLRIGQPQPAQQAPIAVQPQPAQQAPRAVQPQPAQPLPQRPAAAASSSLPTRVNRANEKVRTLYQKITTQLQEYSKNKHNETRFQIQDQIDELKDMLARQDDPISQTVKEFYEKALVKIEDTLSRLIEKFNSEQRKAE